MLHNSSILQNMVRSCQHYIKWSILLNIQKNSNIYRQRTCSHPTRQDAEKRNWPTRLTIDNHIALLRSSTTKSYRNAIAGENSWQVCLFNLFTIASYRHSQGSWKQLFESSRDIVLFFFKIFRFRFNYSLHFFSRTFACTILYTQWNRKLFVANHS